jgi:hypothetical protein
VWVDALANYISALGWGTEGEGSDALFQQFWPQKEGAKSKEGDDSASPEVTTHVLKAWRFSGFSYHSHPLPLFSLTV